MVASQHAAAAMSSVAHRRCTRSRWSVPPTPLADILRRRRANIGASARVASDARVRAGVSAVGIAFTYRSQPC